MIKSVVRKVRNRVIDSFQKNLQREVEENLQNELQAAYDDGFSDALGDTIRLLDGQVDWLNTVLDKDSIKMTEEQRVMIKTTLRVVCLMKDMLIEAQETREVPNANA